MFKKEYIVTKHSGISNSEINELCESDKELLVICRNKTVTEAIKSLITILMSEGILKGIHESPYDELIKYQVDELVYRIEDNVYIITEIIDDDCSSISRTYEGLT